MPKQKFKITKFENPGGKAAFRVSGTLFGERVRKNFETRTEAVACRQELNVDHLKGDPTGQTIWTTLTNDQNRDAIAAANQLKAADSKRNLSFAVSYFLQHYKEAAEEMTVSLAVKEYLCEKDREVHRDILTFRQYRSIKIEMEKFNEFFGERIVGGIQPDEIKDYLESPPRYQNPNRKPSPVLSLKTFNNRRGYLSTLFKFCFLKKFVAENPIPHVPHFKIKKSRGTATTLSAEEAKEFMAFLETYKGKQNKDETYWGKEGCMVPYYTLALFAGIRPDYKDGEITKLRPKDIRLDTGVILIEPEASKVNEKRSIKIQPNLRLWLEKYQQDEFPIIPERRFRDMWADVRTHYTLPHDVLRHTFISMTVGAFRSVGDASLQAGNSELVIRKHYLDLKSVEEADKFWRITPKGMNAPSNLVKVEGRFQEAKELKAV
jgi:integrase